MDLDARAVQRNRFELEAHELVALQLLEDLVEDPGLRPPIHPGVDGVPSPKPSRQPTPLAAVFGDIQNGIEYLQIGEADVAPLDREVRRNAGVLSFGEFHAEMIT